jgi:hypothetical protein
MQRFERNPFKVIISSCDAVKTWCILLNMTGNGITYDTYLFIIGFCIIFANFFRLCFPIAIPLIFWQSALLIGTGVLFFPYTVYYLLFSFYRPIPFFYKEKWTSIPSKFIGKVVIFGKSDYSYEVRDIRNLFKDKMRTESTKIPFYWNHGQIEIAGNKVKLDIVAKGALYTPYFQGIINKNLTLSIDLNEITFGRATLRIKNFPALKFTSENNIFYTVLIS